MQKINDLSYLNANFIGLLIAGLYFYFGIYSDNEIEAQIKSINEQITSIEEQIAAKQSEADKEQEVKRHLNDKKVTLGELESYYPITQSFVSLGDAVKSQLNRFSIREITRAPARDKATTHEFYETLPINFVLEGSYGNLLSFVNAISNHNNLIVLENLNLIRLPGTDNLRAELLLKGYKSLASNDNEGGSDTT